MARNLVQIADDVKDMSVAQIRRHIQEGSHIPIWILTGELDTKLKNLATAGAQQAAAQKASQPATVGDGLMDAVGNIPEAAPDTTVDMTAPNPLSNAGATAAAAPPQPNPAIQALMAAQNPTARMAGGGMPTVRAVRGYNAPVMYPGKSMGSTTTNREPPLGFKVTPEMWAMITAARQKRGDPRLYGEGKARFEEAYVKGAKPTSEPAFGGILSQLAAVERDRAYGGSDTLPYSMTGSRGGPVGNLPTVRMQGFEQFPDYPDASTGMAHYPERPPVPDAFLDLLNRITGENDRSKTEVVAPALSSIMDADVSGPVTSSEVVDERVDEVDLSPGPRGMGTIDRSSVDPDYIPFYERYWKRVQPGWTADGGGESVPTDDQLLAAENAARLQLEGQATQVGQGEGPLDVEGRPFFKPTVSEVTSVEEVKPAEAVVLPPQPPVEATLLNLGDADISNLNVTKKQDLDGGVSLPAVSTLSEMVAERKALAGDFTERERVINEKAAADLKTFEDQKVVPQSVKDIRGHIAKSIEALERNPLPWMRAAAAAINGRQPMLVAMTNAMIGYTEGKEELRKEGLETMGKLVDLDMQVAGLEAQRAADIFAQKQLITQAQRAEVQGDRDRAAQYITSASASRDAALGRNIDIERIEAQKYVAHMNLFGTDRAAAQDVLKALFTEHGNDPKWFTVATDGTATPTAHAYTTAYETVDPKAPSYAGQTAFFAAQKYKKDVLNTINDVKTDAMKLADEKFARELLAEDSPFKRWMAANGLSLPEGATVDDPTSMGMYQMWAITQDERYINDSEIQAAIHQRFPDLRRIQSGGSGNDDPLNWKK